MGPALHRERNGGEGRDCGCGWGGRGNTHAMEAKTKTVQRGKDGLAQTERVDRAQKGRKSRWPLPCEKCYPFRRRASCAALLQYLVHLPAFLWSTSLTGPGAVPDCDADLSTYYPAAPAHRTAAPRSLQRRPTCLLLRHCSLHPLPPARRPLHPLVTPPYPLAAPTAPLVAPGHHSACAAPARDSASSAEPASCSATPPHHCSKCCTTSPACCLGLPFPCFPNNLLDRVYPTLVTSSVRLNSRKFVSLIFFQETLSVQLFSAEVPPFGITRTAGPLLLSFLPPPPSASRHRCPYSRRLVHAFRELLTGGGCADKVSVCSLYRQTASASDVARLLGGKWSGGRPEREGGV
ncbi:hypothetical protein B0H14DRAFT_3737239 [Mycena olivaceomarginata]|nr:hypothetical protein B0H14DRAFT_3737239 [Mycena olivaceomarginata]